MRRAMDVLEAEEVRRDADVDRIRQAVASTFAVGGDLAFVVLTSAVHEAVREALGLRLLRPRLRSLITQVVIGMGAEVVHVGGRPLFAGVRRLDQDSKEARRRSTELRKKFRGAAGGEGGEGAAGETAADWERILAAEGMPPELPLIKRGGSLEKLSTGRPTKREGIWRTTASSRAEIYAGAHERTTDLLAEVELEARVLRARAEGLSLRAIGIRLGLDKMAVDRVLKRVAKRLGQDVQAEGGE